MAQLLVGAALNIGVGLLVNTFFGPKQPDVVQEGPRLRDLSVSKSAYGEVINRGFGTHRVGGNIIWAPGIVETANTVRTEGGGGKGGGGGGSTTTTTYTYSASFATGIAEGPIDKILRIWADSKLIFDATGISGIQGKFQFETYFGTETQLPDPLIEADIGVGEVPAFRGLVYIVANNWQLADFGNRIPNLSFEVAFVGSTTAPFASLIDPSNILDQINDNSGPEDNVMFLDPFEDVLYHLENGATQGLSRLQASTLTALSGFPSTTAFNSPFQASLSLDLTGVIHNVGSANNVTPVRTNFLTGQQDFVFGGGTIPNNNTGIRMGSMTTNIPNVGSTINHFIGATVLVGGNASELRIYEADGTLISQDTGLHLTRWSQMIYDHHNKRMFIATESTAQFRLLEPTVGIDIGLTGPSLADPEVKIVITHDKDGVAFNNSTVESRGYCIIPDEEAIIIGFSDSMVKIDMNTGAILARNFTVGFTSPHNWTDNGLFAFLRSNSPSGDQVVTVRTSNLEVTDTQDLTDFFSAEAVPTAKITTSGTYDPRTHSLIFIRQNDTPKVARMFLNRGSGQAVGLDVVVQNICLKAGLTVGEIDVTDLVAESVEGYVLNTVSTGREALEPLQQAFLFDGVESDFKMKFTRRGKTAAITILQDDVGILGKTEQGERITETRQQEVELPRRFTVRFAERDNDYQQGSQFDKRSLQPDPTVRSEEEIVLDLPLVMTSAEARKLAQRWLYTSWAERVSVTTKLPWTYLALDAADVVNLVTPRSKGTPDTLLIRFADIELGTDLTLDVMATVEDARSNDSAIVTDGGTFNAQAVPGLLPAKFHGLDIPLLGPDDASLQQFSRAYFAMTGQGTGVWPGGTLFRSDDGGNTFLEQGSSPVPTAYGFTAEALADPATVTAFDEEGSLSLTVLQEADLFQNATELQVINGANALAVIKANGDVEILQFQNVTVSNTNVLTISRLLRGRAGTEPISTGHLIGERFVLLEVGRIFTFPVSLLNIGVSKTYKAVTLGTVLEDALDDPFAYKGVDLKPYSPVQVAAVTNVGDVDITWVRRTRFNGGLRDGDGIVPLNETSEDYEVDIFDQVGPTFLRTLTVTSEAATYTAAQQTTDGNPVAINIVVFQKSAVVGRGRPSSTLGHTI